MTTLIERLKNPEDHYEVTDPKKANAVLMSLCQEAADALAAPVQEPVADAWMHKDGRLTDAKAKTARVENFHDWRPLAFIDSPTPPAQPAPVQPVAMVVEELEDDDDDDM